MVSFLKSICPFILMLLLFGSGNKAVFGQKILGGDLSYLHIDSNKYSFRLNIYRACQDSALGSTLYAIATNNKNTAKNTLAFLRDSIKENNNICRSGTSPCLPQNTAATAVGMEIHYYSYTINFNDSTYQNWLNSGACQLTILHRNCCQNQGGRFFRDSLFTLTAMIDFCNLKKCQDTFNSGIAYNPPPNSYLNCNVPFRHNMGGIALDSDSLSHYDYCQEATFPKRNCTNTGNYTYLTPYCPLTPNCPAIPIATPPIGVYFDPSNADFIFQPINCSETGQFNNYTEEWRKDTNGTYQIIGRTKRFTIFTVDSFGANNPPEIFSTPFNRMACEGEELCFDIKTKDKPITLPPPASQPAPDTTYLSWSKNLSNATLHYLDSTAREKTGRFCWTPSAGMARSLPYQFIVSVSDSACPRAEKSSYSFSIIVVPRAIPASHIAVLSCGKVIFEGFDTVNIAGGNSGKWEIFNPKDSLIYTSSKFKDSITLDRTGGIHLFKYTSTNTYFCSRSKTDTLFIAPHLYAMPIKDTFGCLNDTLIFTTSPINGIGKTAYSWKNLETGITIDSFSSLALSLKNTASIALLISDSLGCHWEDTFAVITHLPFIPNIGSDLRICATDSARLSIKNAKGTLDFLWNTGDTIPATSFLKQAQLYSLTTTDSNGCKATDSLVLNINLPVLSFAGNDTTVCHNSTFTFTAQLHNNSTIAQNWFWYDLENNRLIATQRQFNMVAEGPKNYRLLTWQIEKGIPCRSNDSIALNIKFPDTLSLTETASFCVSDSFVNLDIASKSLISGSKWSLTGFNNALKNSAEFITAKQSVRDSSILYCYQKPGVYTLKANNALSGCLAQDSFVVIIHNLPNINLQELDTVCYGTSAGLRSFGPIDSWYAKGVKNDSFYSIGVTAININQIYYGPFSIFAKYTNPTTQCAATDSIDVVIKAQPVLSLSNPTPITICAAEKINLGLSNLRNDGLISWSTLGDGFFSNTSNNTAVYTPSINEVNQGLARLNISTRSVKYNCPIPTINTTITINPLPKITATIDPKAGCSPLLINASVSDSLNQYRYQWISANGAQSNAKNAVFTFSNNITNTLLESIHINLENKLTGCKNAATIDSIMVYQTPWASYLSIPDQTVPIHEPIFTFTSQSSMVNSPNTALLWDFGDGGIGSGVSVTHRYTSRGNYWVKHTVKTDKGCQADTSMLHYVKDDAYFYAPNAFGPNSGGPAENDKYKVSALGFKSFSISIYNRWGELLYRSEDAANHGWDGTYKGNPCPAESYLCIITTSNQRDLFENRRINILLMR